MLWEQNQSGHTVTDLGTLPGHEHSVAVDINNVGRIVGSSFPEYLSRPRAVIWEKDSSGYPITELDPLSHP